ncbi:MAG: transglutaminase domain-containing protein [Ignavibacteriaceae bacterium]|nr:transglutaminase domain-containing protein [Ignavibacteriaceae bacterium]
MRKIKIILILFVFFDFTLFYGCSGSQQTQSREGNYNSAFSISGPRYIEAEFIIRIDSVIASGDLLLPYSAPSFLIWSSGPFTLPNQKIEKLDFENLPPSDIFTDHENGNIISCWDLTGSVNNGKQIIIKRKFSGHLYNLRANINSLLRLSDYDTVSTDLFYFYTKSEPSLEQSPEIILLAHEASGGNQNLNDALRSLFDWVRNKMKYIYPPEKRGVLAAIEKYEGDCGQYSALFITLCRALGIPARQQSGFAISDGKFGYHVWSEVYIPGTGWVPMDTTVPDGFCTIKNTQLVASVGMNIPLKHLPTWSTYSDNDAQGGRTDFMQFMTTVKSGIQAKISTERRLLDFREIKENKK